jgi:hypothetical protein
LKGVFVKIKTPFRSRELSDSGSLHFSLRIGRLLSVGSGGRIWASASRVISVVVRVWTMRVIERFLFELFHQFLDLAFTCDIHEATALVNEGIRE